MPKFWLQFMKESEAKGKVRKSFIGKLCINVLIMLAVLLVLVWGATLWLDVWTEHGEYAVVPSVKGMGYDVAVDQLKQEGFVVELSDSVYDTTVNRGSVVNQNPSAGSKVKRGRQVYLTVNAFAPRSVSVPQLKDTSRRQAESILKGLGFTHVDVVEVPSEYKNLVISVKRNGKVLNAGARVPIDSRIVVEVGAGVPEYVSDESVATDSLVIDRVDLY